MAKKQKKIKIDFRYNLSVYWSLLKKYRFFFFGLLFLIFLLESTRVINKYLFKEVIDASTRFSTKALLLSKYTSILTIILLVFLAITIFNSAGYWLRMHMINLLDARLILDLKRKFFNHIIHLSYNFHSTHKTGSLISRIIRGGSAVERLTDVFVFNFAPLLFQFTIVAASLLFIGVIPALISFFVVVVFIAYSYFINNIQQKSNLQLNQAEDEEKANISDVFTNIDSIKYFGKENRIKSIYRKFAVKTRNALLKNWNYFRWLDSGQLLILGIGLVLLVWFSVTRFIAEDITIGTMVFLFTVFNNLFGPLFGFVHGMRNFYRSMADFQDLFKYAKIKNEIEDLPNAGKLKIVHGDIEFKNVSFKYKKRKIFSDFNLKIPRNKKIALVGPSGSGKTTLIRLLFRLYDVNSGAILIDGKNIKEFKQESLRSELSIVPQECVLFDDTIYNNIAFSNPKAKRKDVFRAMKFAQLLKIVNNFPKKEKTVVGERGVKLSGGEKQRVSIARAILADKKVLVLDEATSSLDSETEHEIQADLQRLMEGRTSIIIAHRLSTIMNADKIIVLDKGKIVQQGTHNQLIKEKGLYKKLWNLQKGGYIK